MHKDGPYPGRRSRGIGGSSISSDRLLGPGLGGGLGDLWGRRWQQPGCRWECTRRPIEIDRSSVRGKGDKAQHSGNSSSSHMVSWSAEKYLEKVGNTSTTMQTR